MKEQSLAELIDNKLPPETLELLRTASLIAQDSGFHLYLVGGVVRDLLLQRENSDIDLVVEGDAVSLAQQFAKTVGGKVITHTRFRTATVKQDDLSIDFITARSETYAKPGALPTVKPGNITVDLARRDFTVNSMAIDLSPDNFGKLIDPHGGQADIKNKLIRILHPDSFIDDATRIWRAIRYEQRLGFTIESKTLESLNQNLVMLNTLSRNRIRHELELALQEGLPEKVIGRADALGILDNLHPELKGDDWLYNRFEKARTNCAPELPSIELFISLLAYQMEKESMRSFITNLNLRKHQKELLEAVFIVKSRLDEISKPKVAPSIIYQNLHGVPHTALITVLIAEDSPQIKKNIELYLNDLSHVRIALNGSDLRQMGVPEGPEIKEILSTLLNARLDGAIANKQEETETVKKLIS